MSIQGQYKYFVTKLNFVGLHPYVGPLTKLEKQAILDARKLLVSETTLQLPEPTFVKNPKGCRKKGTYLSIDLPPMNIDIPTQQFLLMFEPYFQGIGISNWLNLNKEIFSKANGLAVYLKSIKNPQINGLLNVDGVLPALQKFDDHLIQLSSTGMPTNTQIRRAGGRRVDPLTKIIRDMRKCEFYNKNKRNYYKLKPRQIILALVSFGIWLPCKAINLELLIDYKLESVATTLKPSRQPKNQVIELNRFVHRT